MGITVVIGNCLDRVVVRILKHLPPRYPTETLSMLFPLLGTPLSFLPNLQGCLLFISSHSEMAEFEQTPGDGEGYGSLACCSPWGCKESDETE